MTNEHYNNLLKKFKNLKIENRKKKDLGLHDYSLINSLLKKNREVELHSNFIYSMINPNSKHYKGNIFLKYFIESMGITENEFDITNALVYKEKAKIDLMITNGKKVIIIENKLDAPDQKHQISRYIRYINDSKYIDNSDISNNLYVVYLSQTKKAPNKSQNSFYGFELVDNTLIWQNKVKKLSDDTTLDLATDLKINYRRIKHSDELYKWIAESRRWLINEQNSQSLVYAFDEYEEILNRLKSNRRKIMALDEYTLSLGDKEQKEMYEFMRESQSKLLNYTLEKLWIEFEKLFPENERENITINDQKFKKFSKSNLKNWLNKDGNSNSYRDIGFRYRLDNNNYIFALGVQHGAFGQEKTFVWKKNIIENIRNKNIFDLINEIKEEITKCQDLN